MTDILEYQYGTVANAFLIGHGVELEADRKIRELNINIAFVRSNMNTTILNAERLRRRKLGIRRILSSLEIETPKVSLGFDGPAKSVVAWLHSRDPANGCTLYGALTEQDGNPT